VLNADTGKPIRRAQVRAGGPDLRDGRSVSTDENGTWELKDLPAGRYTITVSKGGYVTLAYGQRRPFEQGRPVEVADGQVVDKLDVSLPRGSVITGRVFDEFGEPVTGARVAAMRNRFVAGQRRLMAIGPSDMTDDIGQFRLHGLSPGDYYVSATYGSTIMLDRSEDRVGYAQTFYPGTPMLTEAQKVIVAEGQEAQNVTIALAPTRVATITGTVTTSSGKPLVNGMIMLMSPSMQGGNILGGTTITKPDGTFTLSNVQPGEYRLSTQAVDLEAIAATGTIASTNATETATVPVVVTGRDITGLMVVTGPTARATGRIVFDASAPPAAPPATFMLAAAGATPDLISFGGNFQIKEDWTFEAKGLAGRRLVRLASAPSGWLLKSVTLNGTDVTDTGIEFGPSETVSGLEISLTKDMARLTGTVQGPRGEPTTDFVVVTFAPDRTKWGYLTRYVKTGRPDQSGRFLIPGLPPGDFLAVALDYLEPGEEQDPDLLERLKDVATPVEVKAGEAKTISLKLQKIQ
jgi:hypothetical protein